MWNVSKRLIHEYLIVQSLVLKWLKDTTRWNTNFLFRCVELKRLNHRADYLYKFLSLGRHCPYFDQSSSMGFGDTVSTTFRWIIVLPSNVSFFTGHGLENRLDRSSRKKFLLIRVTMSLDCDPSMKKYLKRERKQEVNMRKNWTFLKYSSKIFNPRQNQNAKA